MRKLHTPARQTAVASVDGRRLLSAVLPVSRSLPLRLPYRCERPSPSGPSGLARWRRRRHSLLHRWLAEGAPRFQWGSLMSPFWAAVSTFLLCPGCGTSAASRRCLKRPFLQETYAVTATRESLLAAPRQSGKEAALLSAPEAADLEPPAAPLFTVTRRPPLLAVAVSQCWSSVVAGP